MTTLHPLKNTLAFGLAILLSVTATGCKEKVAEQETSSEVTENDTKENITASSDDKKTDAEGTETSEVAKEIVNPAEALAKLTAKNSATALYLFMAKPDITSEQKACIENISLDSSLPDLQTAFSDKFTDDELKKALELYNTPEIKAMTEFGLQSVKMMAGVAIENPLAEPKHSEKAMKKIETFAKSDLGKRLSTFEAANAIVKPAIEAGVKACGVEPVLEDVFAAALEATE